jgi:hypothetical protein
MKVAEFESLSVVFRLRRIPNLRPSSWRYACPQGSSRPGATPVSRPFPPLGTENPRFTHDLPCPLRALSPHWVPGAGSPPWAEPHQELACLFRLVGFLPRLLFLAQGDTRLRLGVAPRDHQACRENDEGDEGHDCHTPQHRRGRTPSRPLDRPGQTTHGPGETDPNIVPARPRCAARADIEG